VVVVIVSVIIMVVVIVVPIAKPHHRIPFPNRFCAFICRFSKDTYTIDETLISSLYMWLQTFLGVLGTLAVIGSVTPWFLIAAMPPFCIYYLTQRYYVPTSRELKRLDSVSR